MIVFGIVTTSGDKRVHVNSIRSTLKELENHLAATHELFFGGL